jgi:iron complex outermembrane receptor protein/hemoglobin/transferrin/lactoferrin receptor protein
MRSWEWVAVAGLVISWQHSAWAESAADDEQSAADDEQSAADDEGTIITVRKERETRADDQRFRDTHVAREEIEKEMPLSLADAMRRAPSASVQQTSPSQATIYVRGVSGRELAHQVDGVRLNSTIFRAGNNPFIGLVDVYSLERVDVRPGAHSVEYGGDAIGGAVLMRTTLPGFAVPHPRLSARLLQTFSSNPLGGASRADVTYATRNWAFRLGGTRVESGAIEPGEGALSPLPSSFIGARREPDGQFQPALVEEQVGTEFQQLGADATLRVRLPKQLSLIARGQHSEVPSLLRYDQITPRFKSDVPGRAESSLTPLRRSMVSLELAGPTAPQRPAESSLLLSWQRLSEKAHFRNLAELCLDPTVAEDACPTTSILLRDPERSIERNRTDALGLSGRMTFRPLESFAIATGASVDHEIVSSKTVTELEGQSGRPPASPRFPNGSSATEAGVYAIPSVELTKSVTLSVSGRASLFHVAIAARDGDNRAPESSVTLTDWSSQALIEWRSAPGLTIGASWGRALRPPNVQDLATQGTRARGRYQVPNDGLTAEHGQSADFGFTFARPNTLLHATVFYQRNEDAIVLAPTTANGETMTADGDTYYTSMNASSVETYGVEASGRLRLHALFSPFARWLAMKGQQTNPASTGLPASTPADRAPPIQGEVGFRAQLTETIGAELMTAFRLKQDRLNDPTNLDDNRIPEGGTPGYAAYYARFDWDAARYLRARLNFDNITDELILEHGSGFYRPGFAVTALVELKLDALHDE